MSDVEATSGAHKYVTAMVIVLTEVHSTTNFQLIPVVFGTVLRTVITILAVCDTDTQSPRKIDYIK